MREEGRKERRKKGTEERDGGKERGEEGRKTEENKLYFKRVTLNGAQH